MTVGHGPGHLQEEAAGALLVQPAAALDVGVHVPEVLVQEHVGLAFAEDDVPDARHIPVGGQHAVGPDLLLVCPHVKDLRGRMGDRECVDGN